MYPAGGHRGTTLTPPALPAAPQSRSVLSMLPHAFKSSTRDAEAGGSCEFSVPGQPEPHRETPGAGGSCLSRKDAGGSRPCGVQEARWLAGEP